MARDRVIYDLAPQLVAVGLSAIVGITAQPGQIALSLELLSGSTLEIVNPNTGALWGQGFPFPYPAIVSFDLGGTIWLAASGASAIVAVLRGRTQGFEGAP